MSNNPDNLVVGSALVNIITTPAVFSIRNRTGNSILIANLPVSANLVVTHIEP